MAAETRFQTRSQTCLRLDVSVLDRSGKVMRSRRVAGAVGAEAAHGANGGARQC